MPAAYLLRGVTRSWRLTLSDGALTHDAAFQAVDERKKHIADEIIVPRPK
jgi:hypothetical protein